MWLYFLVDVFFDALDDADVTILLLRIAGWMVRRSDVIVFVQIERLYYLYDGGWQRIFHLQNLLLISFSIFNCLITP